MMRLASASAMPNMTNPGVSARVQPTPRLSYASDKPRVVLAIESAVSHVKKEKIPCVS